MSDFYGALESTSFRVRDREAWLLDPDVQRLRRHAQADGFFDESEDGNGYFCFGWYGQYPSIVLTWDEADEEKELDITDVIQRHILPGDVCQVGVSGSQKLIYIGGPLWWVTSAGTVAFDGTTDWESRLTLADLEKFATTFARDAQTTLQTARSHAEAPAT